MFSGSRKLTALLMLVCLCASSFYLFSSKNAVKVENQKGFVGIILPDTSSSSRWNESDRQALLTAFSLAGIKIKIENAAGSKTNFQTIADRLLSQGAKVLVLANLDSISAKQVQDKAKAEGIPTIDYDRLTVKGSSSYFITFDGQKIGELQATSLKSCIKEKNLAKPNILILRGPDSDENAINVARGYFSVLAKDFQSGASVLADNVAVPNWNADEVAPIVRRLLLSSAVPVEGIVAGNDGIALAAIDEIKRMGRKIPECITSQDATDAGLAALLTNNIYMTVFKDSRLEAQATALLAASLLYGQGPNNINGVTDNGIIKVPSIVLHPESITRSEVKSVIDQGFTTQGRVCAYLPKPIKCSIAS